MIKASEFQTVLVNTAAYTPDTKTFAPAAILASAMGNYADVFNGEINVFPAHPPVQIAALISPDVPRVLLKSSDKRRTLHASLQRVVTSWTAMPTDDSIPSTAAKECAEILLAYFRANLAVQVDRLGFVIDRVAVTADPSKELINHFCKPTLFDPSSPASPLRNSRGFQLRNLKTYTVDGFTINSWVIFQTGQHSIAKDKLGVVFRQDLSTTPDKDRRYDPDQIASFFTMVETEAAKILELYFPG